MIQAPGKTRQKILRKTSIVVLILLIVSVTAFPALGDDDETDFIIPDYGYTVDYYRSYGEPILQASVTGNPELNRGETADLQIKIANKGVIEGFQRLNVNQTWISDSSEEKLAVAEMEEEEEECTTAKNINAYLVSETEYIEIESATNIQNVEELETGDTANLRYTISVDSDTPAGNYVLLLPVSYDYQANVRTATGEVMNLGLTDMEYTREYKTKTETLRIPVSIKSEPKLEVADVTGTLKQGENRVIEITYTNTRESVAQDAMARIIVMTPLSTEKSIVRLGDIGPGENKTASFEIAATGDATVKNYGIDSEIKYVDEDGETSFSDNLKVHVPLEAAEKKISTTGIAIILIILIALYQIVNMHRKRNQNDDENASGDENE
ncbi:COG1361 S-layer family protein [Methanosarcina sp. T3]|uniref:COG1361 S-layer family protein n=1 Tax=Methanosarcina sp. T3 TaxID=3439062 RepID=UPI003F8341F4